MADMKKQKKEKKYTGLYFLIFSIIFYIALYLINPALFDKSLNYFISLVGKILAALVLVYVLMVLFDLLISNQMIMKNLGRKSGIKGWVFSIIGGILSTGPIYLWYPMLEDAMKKGARPALVASFIYNRAVKIPLLPFMIIYFGIVYTIILTVIMIIASVINGLIFERFVQVK